MPDSVRCILQENDPPAGVYMSLMLLKINDLSVCPGCLFLKHRSFFLVGWCCERAKHIQR